MIDKPKAFYFNDHIMYISDREPPKAHKHLAAHLIISLDDDLEWHIEKETETCRGIYIAGNVDHYAVGKSSTLTFLFIETRDFNYSPTPKLENNEKYRVLDNKIVEAVINVIEENKNNTSIIDSIVLKLCKITKSQISIYDSRISNAISIVEKLEGITNDTIEELSKSANLSQSRFSHLFKEETGVSLSSFLAFEKLRKTYKYLLEGTNITDSCIKAGFDSSSHCAASCTRMFGISLKKIAFI